MRQRIYEGEPSGGYLLDYFAPGYERDGVRPSGSVGHTLNDGFIHFSVRLPLDNIAGTPSSAGVRLADEEIC